MLQGYQLSHYCYFFLTENNDRCNQKVFCVCVCVFKERKRTSVIFGIKKNETISTLEIELGRLLYYLRTDITPHHSLISPEMSHSVVL